MRIFPVFVCTLALATASSAQTPKQQKAARIVFERFRALNQAQKLDTPSARSLVTGEALQYVKAPQLGPLSPTDAFTFPDASHAVARVQGLSEKGLPLQDVYFYLVRSGATWKVSALRSLALTGIISMAGDQLAHKSHLSVKERDELANIKLTLSLDADLRTHFQRNRTAFDRLATSTSRPLSSTEITTLQRQLAFDPNPTKKSDAPEWVIGVMVDNTVGYGYSKSGKLPAISNDEVIWVERLSPHWYLFRTT